MIHRQLEKAAERYDLSQDENIARFNILLRKYKVEQLLEAAGAVRGDPVLIGYKEFTFYPDYYPSEDEDAGAGPEDEQQMPDEEARDI